VIEESKALAASLAHQAPSADPVWMVKTERRERRELKVHQESVVQRDLWALLESAASAVRQVVTDLLDCKVPPGLLARRETEVLQEREARADPAESVEIRGPAEIVVSEDRADRRACMAPRAGRERLAIEVISDHAVSPAATERPDLEARRDSPELFGTCPPR